MKTYDVHCTLCCCTVPCRYEMLGQSLAGQEDLLYTYYEHYTLCAYTMTCRYEMLGQSLAGPGALVPTGGAAAAADPACLENLQETLLQLLLSIHPLLPVPGAMPTIAVPLCQVRPYQVYLQGVWLLKSQ